MAKSATILIKLVSTADTGFYYVTKKNPRNTTEKMEFRKYDPVVRKHVPYKEAMLKYTAGRRRPAVAGFPGRGDPIVLTFGCQYFRYQSRNRATVFRKWGTEMGLAM